jgi:hypothetical protein
VACGDLIARKNRCSFFHITEAARIVWQHADQLRRHPVCGQHIVAAAVLDVQEVIFGGHLTDGDQLQAVFLAAWCIEEDLRKLPPFFV